MYGYMDETGAPGVATRPDDFLAASLVVFSDKESAEKCSAAIDRLRVKLRLPDDYEFHNSRNSPRPTEGFIKLMANLEFKFISVAIRKTGMRSFASYQKLAERLLMEMKLLFDEVHVKMDTNPILLKELKKQSKKENLKFYFRPVKSHSENLVQLADYTAALSKRKLKNTPRALAQYRTIAKKQLAFSEI